MCFGRWIHWVLSGYQCVNGLWSPDYQILHEHQHYTTCTRHLPHFAPFFTLVTWPTCHQSLSRWFPCRRWGLSGCQYANGLWNPDDPKLPETQWCTTCTWHLPHFAPYITLVTWLVCHQSLSRWFPLRKLLGASPAPLFHLGGVILGSKYSHVT